MRLSTASRAVDPSQRSPGRSRLREWWLGILKALPRRCGVFTCRISSGDGNPATSDGIFIYNASANSVSLGDLVRVDGTAEEYQGQTQISATSVAGCGSGYDRPAGRDPAFSGAGFPRALRRHAGAPASDTLRYRALPAGALRTGSAVLRWAAAAADECHCSLDAAALAMQAQNDRQPHYSG